MSLNVISYSLFLQGNISSFSKYIVGVRECIKTRDLYFSKYHIYIFYDDSLEKNKRYGLPLLYIIKSLVCKNIRCFKVKGLENHPTYVRAGYRFLALKKTDVNIVLFRDIDSPLTRLDRNYVDNWITISRESVMTYRSIVCTDDSIVQYSGGGTSINKSLLINKFISYKTFIPCFMKIYSNLYHRVDYRGFDEFYLTKLLSGETTRVVKMFTIKEGIDKNKWFPFFENQESSETKEPLLDFVKQCDKNIIKRYLKRKLT